MKRELTPHAARDQLPSTDVVQVVKAYSTERTVTIPLELAEAILGKLDDDDLRSLVYGAQALRDFGKGLNTAKWSTPSGKPTPFRKGERLKQRSELNAASEQKLIEGPPDEV